MKKSMMSLVLGALVLTSVSCCSQAPKPSREALPSVPTVGAAMPNVTTEPRVYGQAALPSYIVQAAAAGATGEAAIRRVFAQYGVTMLTPLGNSQYEIRFSRDPGLEALKGDVNGSGGAVTAVQPNYIYKAMPTTNYRPQ